MIDKKEVGTGSIFWIIFILMGFVGITYLGIWGYHAESIKAIALASIFGFMIIGSIALTKGEVFRMGGSWSAESFSFTLLFWVFFVFGTLGSILSDKFGIHLFSMTGNSLFTTIRSSLPISFEAIMDTIIIPIAEEQLWIIALPIMLYQLMNLIGKKYAFVKNNWFQLSVIILICSSTFAIFHVGNMMLIGFLIAAVVFRTMVIVIFWGDKKANLFTNFTFYVSGIVGAHSGNNVAKYGLSNAVASVGASWVGILLILFYLFIFGSAVYFVANKFIWRKGRGVKQ